MSTDLFSGSKDATETEDTKASEKFPEISKSATKSKDVSQTTRTSFVQATISTLFKKKEEKVCFY